MYAKLYFNSGTTPARKLRDIARIIHESNSGTASLSNLEFINVAGSELISTVNSGWEVVATHNGGTSIPTAGDAITTSDNVYYLQGTCVDSSKLKYAALSQHGALNTLLDAANFGLILGCVTDYGTAKQALCEGSSDTHWIENRSLGIGSSVGNEIIHIFATPRKLIAVGEGYGSRTTLMAHMEFAENDMTIRNNLVPICKINSLPTQATTSRKNYMYYGTNMYTQSNSLSSHFYFPGSIYENIDRPTTWRTLAFYGDGTNAIGGVLGIDENGVGINIGNTNLLNSNMYYGHSWYCPRVMYGGNNANEIGAFDGKVIDANGNYKISMVPLALNVTTSGTGLIDFTQCEIYKTRGQLGINGDELTIGSDTYFYFTSASNSGALLIKKE